MRVRPREEEGEDWGWREAEGQKDEVTRESRVGEGERPDITWPRSIRLTAGWRCGHLEAALAGHLFL